MAPDPTNGAAAKANTHLLKQLAFIIILFFTASSILYSQSISKSHLRNLDWLDHTNLEDDHIPDTGLNATSTWAQQWMQSIPTHHKSPYILYVHVGKTGGIALEKGVPIQINRVIRILRCIVQETSQSQSSIHIARQSCLNQFSHPVAELAQHILAHKHLWSALYQPSASQPDLMEYAMANIDTILITTRNPIDRVVSAFNYHRDELVKHLIKSKKLSNAQRNIRFFEGESYKEIFYNCFPDIRYMAEDLGRSFGWNATWTLGVNTSIHYKNMNCTQLARTLLSTQSSFGLAHYTSNYRWYKNLTIEQKPKMPVLVVRTEHLWQDAAMIEEALGGNASNFVHDEHVMSHGSEGYAVTTKLENSWQKLAICCAMYDDLMAYREIMLVALNLSWKEKEEMMKLVSYDCSGEVSLKRSENGLLDVRFWEDWYKKRCIGS